MLAKITTVDEGGFGECVLRIRNYWGENSGPFDLRPTGEILQILADPGEVQGRQTDGWIMIWTAASILQVDYRDTLGERRKVNIAVESDRSWYVDGPKDLPMEPDYVVVLLDHLEEGDRLLWRPVTRPLREHSEQECEVALKLRLVAYEKTGDREVERVRELQQP